jgi:hypothetical protein
MKTALITCHQLVNFAGSECMVLDIANELLRQNINVTVATFQLGYPIQENFEKDKVNVVNVLNEQLINKKYDYLICFHNIVFSYLLKEGVIADKRCFFSLGPNEPLERPMSYHYLFNFAYFNSEECLNIYNDRRLIDKVKKEVFLNSVPRNFINSKYGIKKNKISKVAIISNHPPEEVLNLPKAMNSEGIEFVFIGRSHNSKHIYVTDEIIAGFDVVVTIGRSVQYCLSLGIPVFCYDRFGGPGYINLTNINASEEYNFSGRSAPLKYQYQELFNRIITGYESTVDDLDGLKVIAKQKYSLEKNLNKVIECLDKNPQVHFNYEDINVSEAIHFASVYGKVLKENILSRKQLIIANKKNMRLETIIASKPSSFDKDNIIDKKSIVNAAISMQDKMKLSVSFNFFNGEELLFAAVQNIRDVVDHISIIYQELSNQGSKISDNALSTLERLKEANLVDDFINFTPDFNIPAGMNEYRKRDVGLESAKVNRCTHFLSMDADEFYEKERFIEAKAKIMQDNISCSVVPSYFYIKKPIYRSLRLDATKVCFIVKIDKNLVFQYGQEFLEKNVDSTRRLINNSGTYKFFNEDEICMHHMSYVRDELSSKLTNSSNAKNNMVFMNRVNDAFINWEFGKEFEFPNQEPHKIIKVPDFFQLL